MRVFADPRLFQALFNVYGVLRHLSLRELLSVAETSDDIGDSVKTYLSTVLDHYLLGYVETPQRFRDLMDANSIVIAGPGVAAVIQGEDPDEESPILVCVTPW